MVVRDIILGFSKTWNLNDGTEQVAIEVITAPLTDDNITLYQDSSVTPVNITDIPLLKLRSHFEPGMLGNNPILHRNIKTKEITLNPSLCVILPLEQVDGAELWFRKTENSAFQKLRHMNVLVFHEAGSDLTFLIPCTVLANYYLGHSKLLKAAMKMMPIDKLRTSINKDNYGQVNIRLPSDVPAKLAPHIARFELDPLAKKIFSNIQPRSVQSLNGSIPSFHMLPPVSGNVTWKIQYVEPASSNIVWVTQIISCDYDFPFTSLLILQDVIKRTGKGTKERKPRRRPPPNKPIMIKPGTHSNTFFETIEIQDENLTNQYPGLSKIKIEKFKNLIKREKQVFYKIKNIEQVLGLSTGVNSRGEKLPLIPTDVSSIDDWNDEDESDAPEENESQENPDTRMDDFLNMIEVLEEKYTVDHIVFPQTMPLIAPIDENILPYEDSTALMRITWCRRYSLAFVKIGEFEFEWHNNARRFVVKRALIEDKFVYIIEFIYFDQMDTGCTLLIVAMQELEDETVITAITKYARNRSGWTKQYTEISRLETAETISTRYRVYKLAHKPYMKDAGQFCKKIIKLSLHSKSKLA